jgi:hypothetical protein
MAEQTEIKIVDDLDPAKRAERRVIVGLDDKVVVIDLTNEHYEELSQFLKPYLGAGTEMNELDLARQYTTHALDRTIVRKWAAAKGVEVPSRGLVPQKVVDQFLAEGSNTQILIGPIDPDAAPA